MEETKTLDYFPIWIVLLSNLVYVLTCLIRFMIMFRSGWIVAGIYLIFILALEYRLISKHCVDCYYWNKTCGFGKGRLSALFFKRGDPSKFCGKEMSWKDMIPDLLISFVPIITGAVTLIVKFDIYLLFALIILISLMTFGNGFIRGYLVCNHCKQKVLGCPAEKLFNKERR